MSTTSRPCAALGDPLVHRQVAPEPVVLGGHVGQRALARQLERRHALGLRSLDRVLHGRASLGTRLLPLMQTAETIRDANVRYHDLAAEHYDSKWGINYGPVGQAQVTSKLRKALGHEPRRYARALEIGAGTGYFSLNLLRAGVIGEAVATDISPGMLEQARALRDRARPVRRDRRVRGGEAALRRRLLRPGVRARRAPPPAGSRRRLPRVPARAAPRRRGGILRRAVPLRRPDRRVAQARRQRRWPRCGGR